MISAVYGIVGIFGCVKEEVSPAWEIWAVLNKTPFLKGLEDTFVKGP